MPRIKMELLLESSAPGSVDDLYQNSDDNPVAGSTYIILHQPSNLALTLADGRLTLQKVPFVFEDGHPLGGKCSWHWECYQHNGWLSFRNGASGHHLSLGCYGFTASHVNCTSSHQLVCLRAGVEGGQGREEPQLRGYVMHFYRSLNGSPLLVMIGLNPISEGWKEGCQISSMTGIASEGTVWRFVKVA